MPIFGAGEFFLPALRAGLFFFPELGGGGGGDKSLFSNTSFLLFISHIMYFFGVRKAVYRRRNAVLDFGVRKQISECERRVLECENRYRSAKALPKASRRIFFAGPLGRRIVFP